MNYANYFYYIWEVGVFLFGKLAYFYLGSWREFTPPRKDWLVCIFKQEYADIYDFRIL